LDRPCILSIWQGKVSVNPTNVVIANQCSDWILFSNHYMFHSSWDHHQAML
jgi:hypothetical protein